MHKKPDGSRFPENTLRFVLENTLFVETNGIVSFKEASMDVVLF